MQTTKVLDFLRCPDDHSELSPASDELVRQINAAIQSGRLYNRGGRNLAETIDGGLIRARGDLCYPIINGIPMLIRDEALPIDEKQGAGS